MRVRSGFMPYRLLLMVNHTKLTSGALFLFCALFTLLSAFASPTAVAAEPASTGTMLLAFPVEKRGNLLTLPIRVGETTYPFVFDTGCSVCAFDESFAEQLGPATDTIVVGTGAGPRKSALHKSPPLRLGPLDLAAKSAIVLPGFHDSCQLVGQDVYGVVGMEPLKDKIFTIDFDQGVVRFLKDAPRDPGTPVPLKWKLGALVAVANIEGLGRQLPDIHPFNCQTSNCQTTARQLPDNCQTTARQLPDNCQLAISNRGICSRFWSARKRGCLELS